MNHVKRNMTAGKRNPRKPHLKYIKKETLDSEPIKTEKNSETMSPKLFLGGEIEAKRRHFTKVRDSRKLQKNYNLGSGRTEPSVKVGLYICGVC